MPFPEKGHSEVFFQKLFQRGFYEGIIYENFMKDKSFNMNHEIKKKINDLYLAGNTMSSGLGRKKKERENDYYHNKKEKRK